MIKALLYLFPEIGIDPTKFVSLNREYCYVSHAPDILLGDSFWNDAANRKEVFLNIAAEKGFDPLLATNWYQFSTKKLDDNVRQHNSTILC